MLHVVPRFMAVARWTYSSGTTTSILLETDAASQAGLPPEVVTAFRKAINYIRQAMDENGSSRQKGFSLREAPR